MKLINFIGLFFSFFIHTEEDKLNKILVVIIKQER